MYDTYIYIARCDKRDGSFLPMEIHHVLTVLRFLRVFVEYCHLCYGPYNPVSLVVEQLLSNRKLLIVSPSA